MTYYIATYKATDGAKLVDEIEGAYDLEMAYEKASKIAKRNGWTLVKVEPKGYLPAPQIIDPNPPRRRDDWPDRIPIIRGCC